MSFFHSERDRLTKEFFDIGGHNDLNVRVETIKNIKLQLIKLLNIQDDMEVKFLINVIDALLIWILEDDKVKAREKVADIWDIFNNMSKLTLFDIRILTAILFSAKTLEEFILVTRKALEQLENYNEHHLYIHIKTTLNNNLSYILMKSKYLNDKEYNNELDNLLFDTTNTLITLSMRYPNSMFAPAIIRKGIILKDNVLIYAGLSLLDTPDAKEQVEFIQDYGIFFITHKNLL